MTVGYQRDTYCPKVVLKESGRSRQEVSLDVLSASYNNIHEDVTSFQYFVVTESEAGLPDAIAKSFYDTEELWWLICAYNAIIDPYTELVAGMRIKIPDLQQVTLSLYNQNKERESSNLGRRREI